MEITKEMLFAEISVLRMYVRELGEANAALRKELERRKNVINKPVDIQLP